MKNHQQRNQNQNIIVELSLLNIIQNTTNTNTNNAANTNTNALNTNKKKKYKSRYSDESIINNDNNDDNNSNNDNFVVATANNTLQQRSNNNRHNRLSSSAFLLANGTDETDFFHVTTYLNTINEYELKFCKLRLINNILFCFAGIFYIAMDCIPYSGIYGPNITDDMGDDFIEIISNEWINKYVLLYSAGAIFFCISSIMDLHLMYLSGCKSEEAAEILINREQARLRAQQRRKRLPRTEANMRGLQYNNNSNSNIHRRDEIRLSHTSNLLIKGSRIGCDGTFNSCSIVAVIAWLLLLGGLFGIASAVLDAKHIWSGLFCNLISVHLYFIQAVAMVIARTYCSSNNTNNNSCSNNNNNGSSTSTTADEDYDRDDINQREDIDEHDDNNNDEIENNNNNNSNSNRNSNYKLGNTITKSMLALGDIFFFLGSLIDCTLSYIYIFFHYSDAFQSEAIATLFGGIAWLICSILYLLVTAYDLKMLKQEIQIENNIFQSDCEFVKQQKQNQNQQRSEIETEILEPTQSLQYPYGNQSTLTI